MDDLKTILLYKMLRDACVKGDLNEVILCIDNGALEQKLYEPLNSAVIHGHIEIVKYLYKKANEYNLLTSLKQKLVETASHHGHLDLVKFFILSEEPFDLTTVLENACILGQLNVISYLIENNSYLAINFLDGIGFKILCNNHHEDALDYLLEKQIINSVSKNTHYQHFLDSSQQRINLKKLNQQLDCELNQKEYLKKNKI